MRAALYTRVSTKSQAEKNGTRYQREALVQLAKARGWEVVEVYNDEGYSGRKESRPGLDAMMRAVERGEVDLVAVWRFDRFARSLSHLVQALGRFKALGIHFVSHQEGIDTSTAMGTMMFQIAGAFSEFESNLARERVAAGLAAAKARGVKLGRPRHPLTPEEARALVELHGGVRPAARATGIDVSTLYKRAKK